MERAQSRLEPSEYTEGHHVIPKSLGGSNDRSNIAILTAREHYLAHRLLCRMTTGEDKAKMVFAFRFVFLRMDFRLTSRELARVRELHSKSTSARFLGVPKSDEHRRKIGDAHRGMKKETTRVWTDEQRQQVSDRHRGKIVSDETRALIARANREREYKDSTREKISAAVSGENNPMFGKSHSEESREKVRQANLGRTPPNKGVSMTDAQKAKLSAARKGMPAKNKGIPAPTYECPGCKRMATRSALTRYHKTC